MNSKVDYRAITWPQPTEAIVRAIGQIELEAQRSDWFPYLWEQIDLYKGFTLAYLGEEVAAVGFIQSHNLPKNTLRLLTRTYVMSSGRIEVVTPNLLEVSPTPYILNSQINFLKENKISCRAIVTMEPRRSLRNFQRLMNNFNKINDLKFQVSEERMKTFVDQEEKDYQHYAWMDF